MKNSLFSFQYIQKRTHDEKTINWKNIESSPKWTVISQSTRSMGLSKRSVKMQGPLEHIRVEVDSRFRPV